jgi:hypothetical protein
VADWIMGSQWGRVFRGTPPAANLKNIDSFTVHYTGAPSVNSAREEIPARVKRTEQHQFNKDPQLSAIGYNYLVDKYGRIIEGRGWQYRNAANGANANNFTSYSVCVLSGVNDNEPNDNIILALRVLYRFLSSVAGKDLIVQGHRDVRATACPGNKLYELVRSGRIEKRGNIVRIAGSNRYETAVNVSKEMFPSGAAHVVVASGAGFADALVAGPFATGKGPLLLTDPKTLPEVVRREIQRLKPKKITIIGGANAVSDVVKAQLEMLMV